MKTYGVINRDPATATSGDCFSQDITDAVELGEEYQYSFWAKLSDVYKDAPEEQRNVDLRRFMYPVEKQLILEVIRQAFFPEKLRKHLPQESGRSFPVHSMFRRPRIRL